MLTWIFLEVIFKWALLVSAIFRNNETSLDSTMGLTQKSKGKERPFK